jgi:Zinc carboxypeptidase
MMQAIHFALETLGLQLFPVLVKRLMNQSTTRYSFRAIAWIACASSLALVARLPADEPVKEVTVKQIYKAVGGPTDPKVPVYWNRYHDGQQIAQILHDLAKSYPDLFKVQSLGKSHQGRDIWVATISDFKSGVTDRKPGFWIDAGIHANEIQADEVALYTAWFLAEMHAENKFIQSLLRDRVFYILPSMSPDSREAHFYRPNTTSSPRSGQRPVDDDRDGLIDEDPANDLNGDGHITQMRIRDPHGLFKPHKKYPNMMVQVEEGEQGEYTLLGTEGFDVDKDGRTNEDGDGYYDPNRDWPWKWQPDYVQRGAFRYPFSLIENRLMSEFLKSHPNIAGAQTYHNTGGMILRGPGSKEDSYQAADLRVYDEIGKVGEKILPGYRYLNVANDLYEVWGGEIDWLHQMLGIYTFTNELFIQYNYFHSKEGGSDQAQEFDKLLLFGDGLVDWVEVDHPIYGKVEVGGMKKNWGRQPPGFMLQEECHRNMAFTLFHADQMPLISINAVTTKKLNDTLTEITAVVENKRVTPTHSSVDRSQKITRPNYVSLQSAGLKVVMGQYSTDSLFRSSSIQDLNPEVIKVPVISGKSKVYIRWLVSGTGGGEITVDTIKGGQAQRAF